MVHVCPQVDCTASYHLDEADEGKTFRCDKCGSMVLFEEGNLTLVSDASPENAESDAVSISLDKPENAPMLSSSAEEKSIVSIVFSWFFALLFGFGSFLVVLFFFLPIIDQASVSRQQARIEAGDRQQQRLDDRLWNPNARRNPRDPFFEKERFLEKERFFEKGKDFRDRGDAPPAPNDEAIRKRKNERTEWDKTARQLEDELEETRGNARGRMYFYAWGMLFGFLILGLASVGFLSFGPTTTRRIFGGIVISAEILLIFVAYFSSFMAMRFAPF
jgi:hypothetical protein